MTGFYSKPLRGAEFHERDNFPWHKYRRRDDEHGAKLDVAFVRSVVLRQNCGICEIATFSG